jgi:hypothetical protein
MEVSTFELIFKPQAPAAPAGVAAVDRVIQGYFLAIANLEAREFVFRVEFVAPPVPGAPNRSLGGNTLVFVDSAGTDNQQGVLTAPAGGKVFTPSTGFVRVPAHGTAKIAVLPSVFGPTPVDPTPIGAPDFEARGYVRLALPAIRRRGPGPLSFLRLPQSAAPVKVLVTPQHRATFLDAAGAITDQIQATLPVAGGAAIIALPPEQGDLVIGSLVVDRLTDALDRVDLMLPEERGAMLAALIGGAAEADGELATVNRALAEAGIGVAVERRGRKAGAKTPEPERV